MTDPKKYNGTLVQVVLNPAVSAAVDAELAARREVTPHRRVSRNEVINELLYGALAARGRLPGAP